MTVIDPLPFPDVERIAQVVNRAFELQARFGHLDARALLQAMIGDVFPDRIALVSSFGSESAVLLHMVAEINPTTPVIFLDTGKLFGETLRYRDAIVERLGLRDVRNLRPEPIGLSQADPDGLLFTRDPDRCCLLRKVLPLEKALSGFDAWITGRKSYQSADRHALPCLEADGQRIKINPVIDWTKASVDAYFERHDLPRHPLEADGFLSIGCMPCTERVATNGDLRSGRWPGLGKTECGIHAWRSAS